MVAPIALAAARARSACSAASAPRPAARSTPARRARDRASCVTTPPPPTYVSQVALFWLKHPERQADRAKLVRTVRSLQMIPGVRRVETRRNVPELPPGADRNFDLAAVVTFSDRAALQRYRKDPRHRETMRRYLRPLVRHYEVYNLSGGQE